MLKKILLVLVALVLVFVVVVALQPSEFHVERSVTVDAPASKVFGEVNDFHKWEAWSPWAKLDPKAKVGFEVPSAGEGTVMTWAGNSEGGAGKMTLVESKPDELVKIKVDFTEPFEGTSGSVRLQAGWRHDHRDLEHGRRPHLLGKGHVPDHERQGDGGRADGAGPHQAEAGL